MDSRSGTLTVVALAFLIGLLAFAAMLAAGAGMYATVLLLGLAMALMAARVYAKIRQLERSTTFALLSLTDGRMITPLADEAAAGSSSATLPESLKAVRRQQVAQQQDIDALHALIDNVSAALFMVNPGGTVAAANRPAQRLASTLCAMPASDRSDDQLLTLESLRRVPAGGRVILRLPDARRVLVTSAEITMDGNTRALIAVQDIQGELDFAELKAWRDLVQLLSHEMMNSLTPVVTLAESLRPHIRKLKTASPAPEVAAIAGDVDVGIEAIARRGFTLVKFIERYRKVASLPRVRLVSVGVADLLARLLTVLQASLDQAGVECKLRVDPADLRVSADVELFEQALLNVVVNAIEAVRDCPVRQIAISAGARKGVVQVEIADTGKGIDASQADRIFLPFFTTKAEGSGIGLSFVKQVMNAHAGQVEVRANQPVGAVFTLTLPTALPA